MESDMETYMEWVREQNAKVWVREQNASRESDDQTAKSDAEKPDLTLVPLQILYDVAEVRRYGSAKYGDPDNWRRVSPERYRKALMRHCVAYIRDPDGVDEESGLPHLWHLACNVAFLCEMGRGDR